MDEEEEEVGFQALMQCSFVEGDGERGDRARL